MRSEGTGRTNKSQPAKKVAPTRPSNWLNGKVPRRDDVPDGDELLKEYLQEPVTYKDLAERYNCSTSLISNRISNVERHRSDLERRYTKSLIELLNQVIENTDKSTARRLLDRAIGMSRLEDK